MRIKGYFSMREPQNRLKIFSNLSLALRGIKNTTLRQYSFPKAYTVGLVPHNFARNFIERFGRDRGVKYMRVISSTVRCLGGSISCPIQIKMNKRSFSTQFLELTAQEDFFLLFTLRGSQNVCLLTSGVSFRYY